MKRQMEVAIHFVLIKIYTVKAIIQSHSFKTTSLALFQKTMKLLTKVAKTEKTSLKEIPEFLIQNMNDVVGLLK